MKINIFNSVVISHSVAGDSRKKTRLAKVVVVANSKQEVFSWTQLVIKYTTKNFGYDYTLYCHMTYLLHHHPKILTVE